MGILSGLLSMFGWGTADFLGAISSRKIGYVLTLFWMQVIGFSVALSYFLINLSSFQLSLSPKFLLLIAVTGFSSAIAYLAFYKGLVKGAVSLVSPIGSSWAVIAVPLGVIFFKEILKVNQIVAVILIIFGIFFISLNLKEILRIKRFAIFAGVKEGLIAMLGWGLTMFLIALVIKSLGWFLTTFLLRGFTILFLIGYIIFTKQSFKITPRPSLLILLLPIGFLDIGAFFTYSFGVTQAYTSIVAPVAASFPLVTIILARIFLKEKLVLNQILGIIGAITGLILISI